MKNVHVFTICAGNYLPKARLLLASVRRRHPGWRLHFAVSDAPPHAALADLGADEIHTLDSLGIPNLRRWIFSHALIELATAIKPFVLKKLLARDDCDAVIYLDPDTVVFSPLTEVTDALAIADIVITPHIAAAEQTVAGIVANEIPSLQHGVYNLGFIAVAKRGEGLAFSAWWAERTYRYCREDVAHGVYTDQRWIDFVPAFFDRVKILRSAGINCAPWNLSGRVVAGDVARGFTVNGRPLVFFHFSHISKVPHERSTGGQAAMDALVEWYKAEIVPTAAEAAVPPYAYATFDDGTPIALEQRMVYRARPDVQRAHPDPFAAGDGSYLHWWKVHARAEYPRLFKAELREMELLHISACLTNSLEEEEIVSEVSVAPLAAGGSAIAAKVAGFIRRIGR